MKGKNKRTKLNNGSKEERLMGRVQVRHKEEGKDDDDYDDDDYDDDYEDDEEIKKTNKMKKEKVYEAK